MHIAVASGKGGTGKTLISTCLTHLWSNQGHPVTYVDADVEAPNGHLFLKPMVRMETRFKVRVPALEKPRCAGHGKCQEICAFSAILSAKGSVIVFNELCHSCGACILACPEQMLVEREREIGTISLGKAGSADFLSGRLDIGEARATPLIEAVVRRTNDSDRIVIIDAPPGTSCSAMAAVRNADLLLLVTEPTPFGMHDLELAVGMGRTLGINLAAVINRADLGDDRVGAYLRRESIPMLAEIPFDRIVAQAYAEACSPIDRSESFSKALTTLGDRVLATMGEAS
ncbi:MAG: ATP-binding protein [Myxococcota bacterium]|nr:ATP-binding protein [Myxococcota bacterium]